MRETIAGIYIETARSAYKDALPTATAQAIYDAAKDIPDLLPLLDRLVLNWRGAAYLCTVPGCFVGTSVSIPNLEMIRSDNHLLSVTELLLTGLQQKVSELSIDPGLQENLRIVCLDSVEQYRKTIENVTEAELYDEFWETMLKQPAFVMYIWYSQRSSYMFAHAAFEHFLVGVTQIRFPSEKVKATDNDFPKKLREVIGEKAERECWAGNEATVRKEVRNSLAHKSGHETAKLAKQTHEFIVTDGLVQIGVSNNKALFKVLAESVIRVCSEFGKKAS